MINGKLTYISLFSSAGVGCYGFKKENYECIATNELLEKRINIQKANKKCKYETGYINDDITKDSTKNLIFEEIKKWNKLGNDMVDVVIATPPCQGMSIANRKKKDSDYHRNSLVVESIKIIKEIEPRFFLFENVPAFMDTLCESLNGIAMPIGEVIQEELSNKYTFIAETINFKNYGSNSSRTRTLVIGVNKKFKDYISPIDLFPRYRKKINTIKEVIGHLPKLNWGEIDNKDFYHQFKIYDEKMIPWVSNTPEGKSAFDNQNPLHRPHKIVDGEIVFNSRKLSGKYTRNSWDKIAMCIHTRNDQMASQSTIHPSENRVFSIRELMLFMTIPTDFRWMNYSLEELNSFSLETKQNLLKKHEMTIRSSIGEAVPTEIFRQIAHNIKKSIEKKHLNDKQIYKIIEEKYLLIEDNLINFIKETNDYSFATILRIIELRNANRYKNESFYTNKFILDEIYKDLPIIQKDSISILEPSVGIGSFLPYISFKYREKEKVFIDVFDIDNKSIELLKIILNKYPLQDNIQITYQCKDTLIAQINKKYDLAIGNPPFFKTTKEYQDILKDNNLTIDSVNIVSYFLEKCILNANYIILITPKNVLNTLDYDSTRTFLNKYRIEEIIDFGEYGFKGVLIETICLFINTTKKIGNTKIKSLTYNLSLSQKQSYITSSSLPYWVIYRNQDFDNVFNSMIFDIFEVFRDRQITNSIVEENESKNNIRVLKSRNLLDDGTSFVDISGYDCYINKELAKRLSCYKYLDKECYVTPNMTYNSRVGIKPKGTLVNGSLAILIPKEIDMLLSFEDMKYFSSIEYRNFYKIARNLQTRSLNIDNTSVFWFGKKK